MNPTVAEVEAIRTEAWDRYSLNGFRSEVIALCDFWLANHKPHGDINHPIFDQAMGRSTPATPPSDSSPSMGDNLTESSGPSGAGGSAGDRSVVAASPVASLSEEDMELCIRLRHKWNSYRDDTCEAAAARIEQLRAERQNVIDDSLCEAGKAVKAVAQAEARAEAMAALLRRWYEIYGGSTIGPPSRTKLVDAQLDADTETALAAAPAGAEETK